MAEPASPVEAVTRPVVTAIPAPVAGELGAEAGKAPPASRNGKRPDSGSSGSFFSWFVVLALLGVWTSVAVVYFDLVDYQGVLGKLVAYDADGDGDFDVEDAKILLDEKPSGGAARRGANKEPPHPKDVGWKLREALKQQLAIIHERVEAKKLAKLALAQVRQLLAQEEEEKELELGRKEIQARVKERVAVRLKEEEEKLQKEETEKALEKLKTKGMKHMDGEKDGEKKSKKEEKEGRVVLEDDKEIGKESKEKRKKAGRKRNLEII